ncbi:hypothetical protein PYCC9005_004151 [Savitreella phatthalungensis]
MWRLVWFSLLRGLCSAKAFDSIVFSPSPKPLDQLLHPYIHEQLNVYGVQYDYYSALSGFRLRTKVPQSLHGSMAIHRGFQVANNSELKMNADGTSWPRVSNAPWQLARIQATQAVNVVHQLFEDHGYTFNPEYLGKHTDVIVLDTGIDCGHRDFRKRCQDQSSGALFRGYRDARDVNGHGTTVASCAAGTQHGAAKAARVVGVRILDNTLKSDVDEAMRGFDVVIGRNSKRRASNREAFIIALLTMTTDHNVALNYAVSNSESRGVLVVAAAGNAHVDACTLSPASARVGLVVGGTDSRDRYWAQSAYGQCVDLVAPAVLVRAALWGGPRFDPRSGDARQRERALESVFTGTSMAAGTVAGVAALLAPLAIRASTGQSDHSKVNFISALVKRLALETPLLDLPPATTNKMLHYRPEMHAALNAEVESGGAELPTSVGYRRYQQGYKAQPSARGARRGQADAEGGSDEQAAASPNDYDPWQPAEEPSRGSGGPGRRRHGQYASYQRPSDTDAPPLRRAKPMRIRIEPDVHGIGTPLHARPGPALPQSVTPAIPDPVVLHQRPYDHDRARGKAVQTNLPESSYRHPEPADDNPDFFSDDDYRNYMDMLRGTHDHDHSIGDGGHSWDPDGEASRQPGSVWGDSSSQRHGSGPPGTHDGSTSRAHDDFESTSARYPGWQDPTRAGEETPRSAAPPELSFHDLVHLGKFTGVHPHDMLQGVPEPHGAVATELASAFELPVADFPRATAHRADHAGDEGPSHYDLPDPRYAGRRPATETEPDHNEQEDQSVDDWLTEPEPEPEPVSKRPSKKRPLGRPKADTTANVAGFRGRFRPQPFDEPPLEPVRIHDDGDPYVRSGRQRDWPFIGNRNGKRRQDTRAKGYERYGKKPRTRAGTDADMDPEGEPEQQPGHQGDDMDEDPEDGGPLQQQPGTQTQEDVPAYHGRPTPATTRQYTPVPRGTGRRRGRKMGWRKYRPTTQATGTIAAAATPPPGADDGTETRSGAVYGRRGRVTPGVDGV